VAPPAQPTQLLALISASNASVVAVQDGRILQIGSSRALGKFVVLRDVYGDEFTYAGLGRIARSYILPKAPSTSIKSPLAAASKTQEPAPNQAASPGSQLPLTLSANTPSSSRGPGADSNRRAVPGSSSRST